MPYIWFVGERNTRVARFARISVIFIGIPGGTKPVTNTADTSNSISGPRKRFPSPLIFNRIVNRRTWPLTLTRFVRHLGQFGNSPRAGLTRRLWTDAPRTRGTKPTSGTLRVDKLRRCVVVRSTYVGDLTKTVVIPAPAASSRRNCDKFTVMTNKLPPSMARDVSFLILNGRRRGVNQRRRIPSTKLARARAPPLFSGSPLGIGESDVTTYAIGRWTGWGAEFRSPGAVQVTVGRCAIEKSTRRRKQNETRAICKRGAFTSARSY